MLLLFSIRVAERPPVWLRCVHSVYRACLSRTFISFFVCPSFVFGFEGGMRDLIVLNTDQCLSIYFPKYWFSNVIANAWSRARP